MTSFTKIINQAKDRGVSLILERWFSQQIEPFGKLLGVNLDSQNKTLRLEALLNGESEPIHITIEDYEIVQQSGQTYLIFNKGAASREWISTVLTTFLFGRKLKLPESYAGMIQMGL